MNSKKSLHNLKDFSFSQMTANNISPLDLFIITKLNHGISKTDLIELVKKEFKIKNPEKTIEERLKKLISDKKPEEKVILSQNQKFSINPSKIYDNILIIFIKTNINTSEKKNMGIGLHEVFDTIIDMNNKPRFGSPIKELYVLDGWLYDLCGIIFESNLNRFYSFRDYLIKEDIVQSIDIVHVNPSYGLFFNPYSLPNYIDFKQFLINNRDRMNSMIDELAKDDDIYSKTIQYNNKEIYGLKVKKGKKEGEIFPIDIPEIKIGRYFDNNIIIDDISVSRRHAKISRVGDTFLFKDESTNGSIVNKKLINYNEIELHDGDTIKIGDTIFQFDKINLLQKKK